MLDPLAYFDLHDSEMWSLDPSFWQLAEISQLFQEFLCWVKENPVSQITVSPVNQAWLGFEHALCLSLPFSDSGGD